MRRRPLRYAVCGSYDASVDRTLKANLEDRQVRIAQTPPTWVVSGTPFEMSPGDLRGYLEMLDQPYWPDTADLQDSNPVVRLGTRYFRGYLLDEDKISHEYL